MGSLARLDTPSSTSPPYSPCVGRCCTLFAHERRAASLGFSPCTSGSTFRSCLRPNRRLPFQYFSLHFDLTLRNCPQSNPRLRYDMFCQKPLRHALRGRLSTVHTFQSTRQGPSYMASLSNETPGTACTRHVMMLRAHFLFQAAGVNKNRRVAQPDGRTWGWQGE